MSESNTHETDRKMDASTCGVSISCTESTKESGRKAKYEVSEWHS